MELSSPKLKKQLDFFKKNCFFYFRRELAKKKRILIKLRDDSWSSCKIKNPQYFKMTAD